MTQQISIEDRDEVLRVLENALGYLKNVSAGSEAKKMRAAVKTLKPHFTLAASKVVDVLIRDLPKLDNVQDRLDVLKTLNKIGTDCPVTADKIHRGLSFLVSDEHDDKVKALLKKIVDKFSYGTYILQEAKRINKKLSQKP